MAAPRPGFRVAPPRAAEVAQGAEIQIDKTEAVAPGAHIQALARKGQQITGSSRCAGHAVIEASAAKDLQIAAAEALRRHAARAHPDEGKPQDGAHARALMLK